MTISSLPQELIDHILSFLASDAPALRACARVHSSWLDPCRRCLFAHKTLYTVDWKLIGAHAVIKRNPALAEYIRAATWDIWDQGAQTPRRALFASLLRRLHRVSALTIEYHQQVPDTTPYAGLVQFVRYAPTATVTALRLAGIVFPSCTGLCAFVASFPTLTDLALHKLRWAVDDADGGDAHGGAVLTTPTLQVLSITDMHLDAQRILSWLLRHPSPPCLRSLHLDVPASPPDIAPLSAVLEHSGPSLEELTIREELTRVHGWAPSSGLSRLSLAANPSLRTLQLTLGHPALFAEIVATAPDTHLRTVRALLGGAPRQPTWAWAAIRTVLEDQRLAGLETIEITLAGGGAAALAGGFPALEARGVLRLG